MNKIAVFGLGFAGLFGLMMLAESSEAKRNPGRVHTYTGQPLPLPLGWDETKYQLFVDTALGQVKG